MRILIDTNIFIQREDDKIIREDLQQLLQILNELHFQILIHPASTEDVLRDKDDRRKQISLSKLDTYATLKDPPDPDTDSQFNTVFGKVSKIINKHEQVDLKVLFSVFRNTVDFLITEDRGIHSKAERIGMGNRVFDICEALEYVKRFLKDKKDKIITPPSLKEKHTYHLDINDAFFDILKSDYQGFLKWWEKICKEQRKCWVYYNKQNKIGALLIYKEEEDVINSIPTLPKKKRLKICTLKVSENGLKIGELFIKVSVSYAIKQNIDEIYLTHFTKDNDYLIPLIEEFGFKNVAKKSDGEDIFCKMLVPQGKCDSPSQIATDFYPSYYDGMNVQKYVIPIRPEFHRRLFTDYPDRQTILDEHAGGLIIEGNTIKKAYLCQAHIKTIRKGDVLLFYQSVEGQKITSIGIVDQIHIGLTDPNIIMRYVGKRTVYTSNEIIEMAQKPTTVILFTWHSHIANPLPLNKLIEKGILAGAPQSIQVLSHTNYLKLKKESKIEAKYTIQSL